MEVSVRGLIDDTLQRTIAQCVISARAVLAFLTATFASAAVIFRA